MMRAGMPGANSAARATFFSLALTASKSTASSTQAKRSKGTSSSSRSPDSILDRSRMPSMTPSRCVPAASIASTYSSCSEVSAVARSRLVKPTTAFIGDRISWLILARKSDLSWVACSATARARSSSSCWSVSSACSASRPWLLWSSSSRSARTSRSTPSACSAATSSITSQVADAWRCRFRIIARVERDRRGQRGRCAARHDPARFLTTTTVESSRSEVWSRCSTAAAIAGSPVNTSAYAAKSMWPASPSVHSASTAPGGHG